MDHPHCSGQVGYHSPDTARSEILTDGGHCKSDGGGGGRDHEYIMVKCDMS